MRQPLRQCAALAAVAAALVAAPLVLRADDQAKGGRGDRNPAEKVKAESKDQMAAGVITKVEEIGSGATPGSTIDRAEKAGGKVVKGRRLTINTDVVWLDWARDQANFAGKGEESPKEAAKEGANSVATKGQPESPSTTVAVDVGEDTKVETRYRSARNESGEGASTPAGAASEGDRKTDAKAKGESYKVSDLKPGLWVEVHYEHRNAQNQATKVIVYRPIRTPSEPGQPAAKGESSR